MQATAWFLGACALACVAGAVGGATTNTTPLQEGSVGWTILPERQIAFDPGDSGLPKVAMPDHYEMTTPEGQVHIAALTTRGLYAQQRLGWREASYERPQEPAFGDPKPDALSDAPSAPPVIAATPVAAPLTPLDLSAPVDANSSTTTVGSARTIDVAATLAARD